jgi:hypothetical protein
LRRLYRIEGGESEYKNVISDDKYTLCIQYTLCTIVARHIFLEIEIDKAISIKFQTNQPHTILTIDGSIINQCEKKPFKLFDLITILLPLFSLTHKIDPLF